MSGWSLRPPTTPGQYHYRQSPYAPVETYTIVELEGEMVALLHNMWMYLREHDGEWKRVMSTRQQEKLELKGMA